MHPQARLFSILVIIWLLLAPLLRAQENPLNDPDLKAMLKEAEEMQKASQRTSETEPDIARHKEETRGNAVPGERRGSTTGAGGKT
jgi:hypothetical protein